MNCGILHCLQCFYGVKELRNALQDYADAPAVAPAETQVRYRFNTFESTPHPDMQSALSPTYPTLSPSPNFHPSFNPRLYPKPSLLGHRSSRTV